MIDLNDPQAIRACDPEGMLRHIADLPNQCEAAWRDAQAIELPESFKEARQVVIAGMGGSAIGGALFQSLAAPHMRIPVHVVRDYTLPAFAEGLATLVIASSYSGDTEETLSAFQEARARRCQLMAIAAGGRLEAMARQFGAAFMRVAYESMPRAALGYSFVPLVVFASRLGWTEDQSAHLKEAVAVMRALNAELAPGVPVVKNLAKREAGQLIGRIVFVLGAGYFSEVARFWKNQVNRVSKAWAAFEQLPEANYSLRVGTDWPYDLSSRVTVLFLDGSCNQYFGTEQIEVGRIALMKAGCNTDILTAKGESPFAQMMSLIHLGNFLSIYLAITYGASLSKETPVD